MRIGQGYDLHRLEVGYPLILGGVNVPHEKGMVGHSDADVLSHAITDALLGAVALGNIGQLFPDTDPAFKGADSLVLLKEAWRRVASTGYAIVNIDSTIIAQQPKLNPHLDAMRVRLAETLEIDVEQLSVKAKTNEMVGPEGREEAISVHAVVLLKESPLS